MHRELSRVPMKVELLSARDWRDLRETQPDGLMSWVMEENS